MAKLVKFLYMWMAYNYACNVKGCTMTRGSWKDELKVNLLYIVVQYLANTNFGKKGRRKCDLNLRKRRVKSKTFSKITRIEEPDSSLSPKQPEPAQCKQSKFIYFNLETGRAYVVRCAIWYHLYILKTWKTPIE